MTTTESPVVGLARGVVQQGHETRELRSIAKSNRRWIKIAMVSVACDIMLTFGLGYVLHRQVEASHALVETCQESNADRSIILGLWLQALEHRSAVTPADRAETLRLEGQARLAYALRQC
jgi:hypothetical protein